MTKKVFNESVLPPKFPGVDSLPEGTVTVFWKDRIAVITEGDSMVFNKETGKEVAYAEDADGTIEYSDYLDAELFFAAGAIFDVMHKY